MSYKIERRPLKVSEYQSLRKSTDWAVLQDETVEAGLLNDLFSVCVLDDFTPVAMGRVIGDGAIYFYIQDVIVLPEYQRKGLGLLVMNEIESYLKQACSKNAFIGLMAARGFEGFYTKFGYTARPVDGPGMNKIMS